MMPDFPSAAGTLSSWRERRREGWKRGRGEGWQLERLPTAGNQLPVTESLHGSGSGEEEKEEEEGEGEEGEKEEDLLGRRRNQVSAGLFSKVSRQKGRQQQGGEGWMDGSLLPPSLAL